MTRRQRESGHEAADAFALAAELFAAMGLHAWVDQVRTELSGERHSIRGRRVSGHAAE